MSITPRSLLAIAALALANGPSWAQEWPAKTPIRIVVPYPAGGNADSSARAVAEVVAANLKQTIIVDNRPGASSVIGTEVVARAPADGYTLGVVSDSHAINQAIAKLPKGSELLGAKVGYDAVRDFVPVSGLIQIPLVLVIHPSVPAKSVKDLVHPLLPKVPTLAESGYPGLDIANYLMVVAPAGTPQPIVERLSREFDAALKQPAMKDKLAVSGDPYPAAPAELTARLRRDIDAYGAVIQANVK